MLDPELKSRLLEHHDWDKAANFIQVETNGVLIEKPHSNPAQRWKRVLRQSTDAMDELMLLAETLPEDKRAELFTPERVTTFVEAMLGNSLTNNISTKMYHLDVEKNVKVNAEADPKKGHIIAEQYNERAGALYQRYLAPLQNNTRIMEIASSLARLCLGHCSHEYPLIETDVHLQELVTNRFKDASGLTWTVQGKMAAFKAGKSDNYNQKVSKKRQANS